MHILNKFFTQIFKSIINNFLLKMVIQKKLTYQVFSSGKSLKSSG